MKWVAFCIQCRRDFTFGGWNNGIMVDAAARIHLKECPTHEVIVGYKAVEVKDEENT